MKKTYTFWFYGSVVMFAAETPAEAMVQANDHFEPLAKDPDGDKAWNYACGDMNDIGERCSPQIPGEELEFIWS